MCGGESLRDNNAPSNPIINVNDGPSGCVRSIENVRVTRPGNELLSAPGTSGKHCQNSLLPGAMRRSQCVILENGIFFFEI